MPLPELLAGARDCLGEKTLARAENMEARAETIDWTSSSQSSVCTGSKKLLYGGRTPLPDPTNDDLLYPRIFRADRLYVITLALAIDAVSPSCVDSISELRIDFNCLFFSNS